MERKLKVFNYAWHLGHQFELMKLPFLEWTWLIQYHRQYSPMARGDFFKGNMVIDYEPGKYDFALLHLDQQCFEQGLWERGKGSLYRELNEVITDIPKIVIMHGTPHYPEMFESQQELVEIFKREIGDNWIIFNSHTAQKQWGFENSPKATTIWHGLDPTEWYDLPKEPRVVTMISPGGLDSYYDRNFLQATRESLEEEGINHCHITVDFIANTTEDYKQFLGRSLLYFNPTRESPMPRSRTEAMLSGCCVLTTANQDAETYFKDKENGIIVPRDPQKVTELVKYYIKHYDEAIKIGQAGKETALELFSKERYQQDWKNWLEKVLNIKL